MVMATTTAIAIGRYYPRSHPRRIELSVRTHLFDHFKLPQLGYWSRELTTQDISYHPLLFSLLILLCDMLLPTVALPPTIALTPTLALLPDVVPLPAVECLPAVALLNTVALQATHARPRNANTRRGSGVILSFVLLPTSYRPGPQDSTHPATFAHCTLSTTRFYPPTRFCTRTSVCQPTYICKPARSIRWILTNAMLGGADHVLYG